MSTLVTRVRKTALILVLIAAAVIAIDYYFREGKLLKLAVGLYAGEDYTGGEWEGHWRVSNGDGVYTIEFNETDSSIRDNVFESTGKWKTTTDPSTQELGLVVESAGGTATHVISQRTSDRITLTNGTTLNRITVAEGSTVSLFGQLKGALTRNFIIVPGYEQTDSLYKAFIPLWDPYESALSGRILTKADRYWVTAFSSPSERQLVASIDTVSGTINLGKAIMVQGVQGECSAQFSIDPMLPTKIRSEYFCAEGDPQVSNYEILGNGDIVLTEVKPKQGYVDEGFQYAPTALPVQTTDVEGGDDQIRFSETDRNPYLESLVGKTSPDGDIFEYGITVVKEQFIEIARSANPGSEGCDWVCLLRELSGIIPVRTDVDSTTGFNYYNPRFINWVFANMVPDPSERFLNATAQEHYIKSYSRAARIYAMAYFELYHLPGELSEYENASKQEGFYGPEYLQRRYGQTLSDYAKEKNATDNIYLHPPQAFGFWLRRRMDDTEKECWDGFSRTMMKYDPVWFKAKLKKYQVESE